MQDRAPWSVEWTLAKYHGDPDGDPYETHTIDGNLLMYVGANALIDRLVDPAPTHTVFDASNTYIGVGDSTTAVAATQQDLQASTNFHREIVDAAPTYTVWTSGASSTTHATVAFVATFETGDANFAWNEVGIFNASTAGTMLNRKVSNMGTKTSADSWVLTCTITLI